MYMVWISSKNNLVAKRHLIYDYLPCLNNNIELTFNSTTKQLSWIQRFITRKRTHLLVWKKDL